MDRRQFLASGLSTLATAALAGCGMRYAKRDDPVLLARKPTSFSDPRIRALFPGPISIHEPGLLGGIDVFAQLPYEEISRRLNLDGKNDAQVLYPGAGSHIAPLEVGVGLQGVNSGLDVVRFLYTEVRNETLANFEEAIKLINDFGVEIVDKKTKAFEKGKEVDYEMSAFGRRIDVRYLMDRSNTEQGDHPYFRRQDAVDSDITLFHDSLFYHPDVAKAVFYAMKHGTESNKPKAIIFDDFARVSQGLDSLDAYDMLPGDAFLVGGKYACPATGFRGAVLFFPEKDEVKGIMAEPDKTTALEDKLVKLYK